MLGHFIYQGSYQCCFSMASKIFSKFLVLRVVAIYIPCRVAIYHIYNCVKIYLFRYTYYSYFVQILFVNHSHNDHDGLQIITALHCCNNGSSTTSLCH